LTRVALFVATAFYAGYAPVVPGTVGSLVGLVLVLLLRLTGVGAAEIIVTILVAVAGVWAAGAAETALGGLDPGPVVIDEVFGMLITLVGVPLAPAPLICGFVLFRILDVLKPWPASLAERLPGGLGIMADDGVAAVYANLLLQASMWTAPGWFA
jgi:phosphatidylglycerophosphatase A